MQLRLTWRIGDRPDMDLLVSEDQTIKETIGILAEKELLDEGQEEDMTYIRSLRTKDQVNILLTYKEAGIYSGDILVIR